MKFSELLNNHTDPVAIGGLGGSGTRLIAACLRELEFSIGADLNEANDNLWFALLFTRVEILTKTKEEFAQLLEIFVKAILGENDFSPAQRELLVELSSRERGSHSQAWLEQRAESLLADKKSLPQGSSWGWKAPNTHHILDRILPLIPGMRYIHVVRNGLDMAHSTNQNQLRIWGSHFMGREVEVTPSNSLKYWCQMHRRILSLGETMGENFYYLNYDHFCQYPEEEMHTLCKFLQIEYDEKDVQKLISLVQPPRSIGRYKQFGIEIFDEEDVAFVRKLGFDV